MRGNLGYRIAIAASAIVLAALYLAPSLAAPLPGWWTMVFPNREIRLGLDLQGGMHLILEVDTEKAVEFSAERFAEDLKRELRERRIPVSDVVRRGNRGVVARLIESVDRQRVIDVVDEQFSSLSRTTEGEEERTVGFSIAAAEVDRIRTFAVEQSLETIRNRVDQLGLTEPVIQRAGEDSILIQLPGETDPERAKSIIGKTAVLEFKLVDDTQSLDSILGNENPCRLSEPERSRALERVSDRATAATHVLCGHEGDPLSGRQRSVPYLLERKILMTGDVITDARPRPDTNLPGNYLVELQFNARGASVFEDVTAGNVGRRLAIVLDDTVYSAPRIQERIGGGRAVITGNFEIRESRDLAIVLRAGALPAPVSIAEERTVGPTLGQDSIRQGLWSFAIGGSLVMVFIAIYYRVAGAITVAALTVNMAFLFGCLAAFGATLTLPGIAGIVLTLGMAVDANVLLVERIREELRLGKTSRAAIEAGYERALPAILDSNLTTFLSGLILFQFGSGPIRGFAVTLCIGIVTSVFSAVFCTRIVYDWLLQSRRMRTLSV